MNFDLLNWLRGYDSDVALKGLYYLISTSYILNGVDDFQARQTPETKEMDNLFHTTDKKG